MSKAVHNGWLEAMSTTIVVMGVGISAAEHQAAMSTAQSDIDLWERLFSRFRDDSLLSRVNASAGSWIKVDPAFLRMLERSRTAVAATDGRFDPSILPALRAHGYDQSFADHRTWSPRDCTGTHPAAGQERWLEVDINPESSRIRLPEGMQIDFGGIAKGALADRLAERFHDWPGGAISIGGDICVWGVPPDGACWRVGIEHPLNPEADITVVELPGPGPTALATSSRTRRSWNTTTGSAHHLIDPVTGAPIQTPILAVSVCADTATQAEIVTKNIMVASATRPLTPDLLLDANWALAVQDSLVLAHIVRETP